MRADSPTADVITAVTRGGKNNRFFDASRFSLERFCLDADQLIIRIKKEKIMFCLLEHYVHQRGIIFVILKLLNLSSVCIGQSDLS